MRFNAPIAGPAHQIAAAAGELDADDGSSGLTPIATRHRDARGDVHSRPGERDPRLLGPAEFTARSVGRVSGEEPERDLGVGARSSGGDGVAEFVDEGEDGDRPGQPESELVPVQEHDQPHEHDEAGLHLHVEAEQAEHLPD